MKHDLLMEYMKFKHVASIQQMNATEHEACLINARLEALKERYEQYSIQGLDLEEVKRLEMIWLNKMRAINSNLEY